MGLTYSSTGSNLLNSDLIEIKKNCDFTIAFAGNPNVGKSTIFNLLTGLHQHTGNWPGKTVSSAYGTCNYKNKKFLLVDLPGTYSLMSNSKEEEIARDFICFEKPNVTVVVVDATCLERNLNLVFQIMEITSNIVVCVNLLDEAKKKNIDIDLLTLEKTLGVPVIGTIAKEKKTTKKILETVFPICTNSKSICPNKIVYNQLIESSIVSLSKIISNILRKNDKYLTRWICIKLLENNTSVISSIESNLNIKISKIEKEIIPLNINNTIVSDIISKSENITNLVCKYENNNYTKFSQKIDKILTSKKYGIPIMLLFLFFIFWLTIVGANYPSKLLTIIFSWFEYKLINILTYIQIPTLVNDLLINGLYRTVSWIISVMLPPIAIFFPLFTLLEDIGILPRIAFNLDAFFKKSGTTGKQSLTMCMGLGCNAAGVVGCRIIDSHKDRLIAMLTNSFIPCNGRFPFLITISTIFVGSFFNSKFSSLVAVCCTLFIVLLGIFFTLIISRILSKILLKGSESSFILELPPYRKPQIGKILIRSLLDRTLFVLGRAISIAAPMGIIIWLFSNITISNYPILFYISSFLDPFARILGLDGYILAAFILGIPANEIVLPIILMCYLSSGNLVNIENIFEIGEILKQNSWTILTGINVMIFTLLHFPCSTTLISIKKESGNIKWSILAFILPTICGISICMLTTGIWNVVN